METNDFTLDDLHDDDNPEVIKDPAAGPRPELEDEPFVPDMPDFEDDALESDDPPAQDPPATKPASDDPPAQDPPVASGLELFLSQYDIEGGMITYDDGTSQHISELSAEEQAKILSSVATDARPSIEEQY